VSAGPQAVQVTCVPVEFRFKGDRDYIQGTDLFDALVGTHPADTLRNIRFTIHGFVRTPHVDVYDAPSREALARVQDVKARAVYERGGAPHWLALVESSRSGAAGRYAYREERVTNLCSIDGHAIALDGASPFTFIETIVAMNKHMHQKRFGDAPGKWIFTGIDLARGCDAREGLELRLGPDPNLRLTRARILHLGQDIGSLFFSLIKA
jgi:hypothetical protein